MDAEIGEFCHREKHFFGEVFQTIDLINTVKDLQKEYPELFQHVQNKSSELLISEELEWKEYTDYSYLKTKGMDQTGLELSYYAITNIKKSELSNEKKQAFLDVLLYVLYLHNENSKASLPLFGIEESVDFNRCVRVLVEQGRHFMVEEEDIERLESIDFASNLNQFEKILFLRLYAQTKIYCERDLLRQSQWFIMSLKLLVFYNNHFKKMEARC